MYAQRKWILAAAASAVLMLNTGCFHSYTRGRPVDEMVLKELVVGEANKQQVENKLGLPDDIIPLENGMIYRYEYSKANTFILLIIGHTSKEEDKVYMIFNDRGVLADKKVQSLTKDLGWRLWPFGR